MMEMPFETLAAKVEKLYAEHMTHQDIADRMAAEGMPPALGHAVWNWQLVNSLLVLAASQRAGLARGDVRNE